MFAEHSILVAGDGLIQYPGINRCGVAYYKEGIQLNTFLDFINSLDNHIIFKTEIKEKNSIPFLTSTCLKN